MSSIGDKAANFLRLKPWHPSNRRNLERRFKAEQQARDAERRAKERADALKEEADAQRLQ